MKSWTILCLALGTAGAVTLASVPADAQRVRTYGDESDASGGESNVYIPGAPVPQQQEAASSAPAAPDGGDASDGEGAQVDPGAYQIRMYGQRPRRQQGQQMAEVVAREATELYRGIIPGQRDEVAHLRGAREDGQSSMRPNPITWIGFQPEEERTRVFFQAPRPVAYQLQESTEANELIVLFEDARIPVRNFSRFIDASHFDRVVERIEATEEPGNQVRVTLRMRGDAQPEINTESGYLYLDFPYDSDE